MSLHWVRAQHFSIEWRGEKGDANVVRYLAVVLCSEKLIIRRLDSWAHKEECSPYTPGVQVKQALVGVKKWSQGEEAAQWVNCLVRSERTELGYSTFMQKMGSVGCTCDPGTGACWLASQLRQSVNSRFSERRFVKSKVCMDRGRHGMWTSVLHICVHGHTFSLPSSLLPFLYLSLSLKGGDRVNTWFWDLRFTLYSRLLYHTQLLCTRGLGCSSVSKVFAAYTQGHGFSPQCDIMWWPGAHL